MSEAVIDTTNVKVVPVYNEIEGEETIGEPALVGEEILLQELIPAFRYRLRGYRSASPFSALCIPWSNV